MKLKKYFQSLPMQERISFAEKCETTFKHLQNVAYGYKPAGESLCINIERESTGIIKCEELRPDVDWEFLRGTSKQDQTNKEEAA
jgi:hypothetical protein